MCKFLLTDCLQIICNNFSAKLVQSVFLCHRLSKKQNFFKIWQLKVGENKDLVCYRKKQSFRQCAWGLRQLVFGYLGKVRKFWQPQTNTFWVMQKKTTGGGKIDPPPPTGIGLNKVNCKIKYLKCYLVKIHY